MRLSELQTPALIVEASDLQHNLAAMVDEPSDFIEPRAETPPYTARRDQVFEKYRKGESPATVYPDLDKAKISEIGK